MRRFLLCMLLVLTLTFPVYAVPNCAEGLPAVPVTGPIPLNITAGAKPVHMCEFEYSYVALSHEYD